MLENKIDLLQLLNNLKYVKRTGPTLFSGISSLDTESTAEHSFKVAYLCLVFGAGQGNIDEQKLVTYAIMHDWADAIIGDIPASSKSYKSYFDVDIKEIVKRAEDKALTKITSDAGLSIIDLTEDEYKLFKFCDIFARVLEVVDMKQKGHENKWLNQMYKVQIRLLEEFEYNFMPELKKIINEIYERGYFENKYLTHATQKI